MADVRTQAMSEALEGPTELISMSFELVVVPVSDAGTARRFYQNLGWRCDIDFTNGADYRVVEFTRPAQVSIIFGTGLTAAQPGSVQGLHLIVSDIDAAREHLLRRGIDVSDVFHDKGGKFYRPGTRYQTS